VTESQEPGERDAELAEQAEGSSDPHTSPEEGHPAGEGERSDRDVGGPTSDPESDDDDETTGGAPGTSPGSDFDPH
jgi:hypothetical protein